MAEAESEEAVRLRSKASGMLKSSGQALIQDLKSPSSRALPASKEPKSSYFLTESLAEMANEDPIRLQNQSGVIREEMVKIMNDEIMFGEHLVYSSLGRLPTFSIGLSSTRPEYRPPAPLRERRVDPKEKYSPRYFQMPELGARIFVGDVHGCDTITCRMTDYRYGISEFALDSENAAVRSFYEDDRPGGLSSRLRGLHVKFGRSEDYFDVILSGTELVIASPKRWRVSTVVGSLRGKGFSSDFKDYVDDKTVRKASDIVQQPRDLVPCVAYGWPDNWRSLEGAYLLRSTQGSYLKKPKFMKEKLGRSKYRDALQLTRFDDFVVLGNKYTYSMLPSFMITDIVRKNASQTADVIAAQLVKSVVERSGVSPHLPTTFVVILLNHEEILLREEKKKENVAQKYTAKFLGLLGLKGSLQSTMLKDDKKITELTNEEKITTSKNFPPEMEDKEGVKIEEDYKEKILVGESLPNVPQISTISVQENVVGVKLTPISSNLSSARVQDDSQASSSVALIEDSCKRKDLKVSCHVTKWIVYGDLLKRTLLCFFNVEDMKFEFYFEDHESMGAIIGLGVPHSKVILECGSPHLIVVEIPKEDWGVAWAHSNFIPHSILKGNVLKQEMFPDILHHIVNIVNADNYIKKANNGGGRGDNENGKAQDKTSDRKGKAQDCNDHGNASHPHEGFEGAPNDNGNTEREEKDGNNDNDIHDRGDGKTTKDCKEVQVVVHLLLLPGGVLEEEEVEGKKKEWGGRKRMEKKKKHKGFCFPLKRGENGDVVGNQEKLLATSKRTENDDVDESLHGNEQKSIAIKGLENIDVEEERKELGEILEEELKRKKDKGHEEQGEELGEGLKGVEKNPKQIGNGNLVGYQQKSITTKGVENGDVDESLKKQLEKQILSQMVFTFTIRSEAGGQLKTIQATIDPITFQLPSNNKENYLQWRRFGWFHDYLQVSFGVVKEEVATLETNSCKVLDSYKAKEVTLQGNSQENASTRTTEMKGEGGIQYVGRLLYKHSKTYGSRVQTTKEHKKSLDIDIIVTKRGGFTVSEHTNHNTCQLKYSYRPYSPFKEEELIHEDDFWKMYENPICQIQRVSCEGVWKPDCSENLEAYKLEASRKLQMTRIWNLGPKIREDKKQKLVWNAKPLCFMQKLEKVVYLNHAMSHLASSTGGVYRLQERQNPCNSSTTIYTQAQRKDITNWPSDDPLVDVCP